MSDSGLIYLLWSDLVGMTRTRAVPLRDFEKRLESGLGWACAGQAMTPFEHLAGNPWGPVDEVRQIPDPETMHHMRFFTAFSEDGIDWTDAPQNPVWVGRSDASNTVVYNPKRDVFMIYRRSTINAGQIRRIAYSESKDLISWSQPITVVTNGVLSFEGMASSDVGTLLRWAAIDQDRTMMFEDELVIGVTPAP